MYYTYIQYEPQNTVICLTNKLREQNKYTHTWTHTHTLLPFPVLSIPSRRSDLLSDVIYLLLEGLLVAM